MPSSGTASNISRQDANDLLQRLITESLKVQAMFWGRGSVTAALQGFVSRPTDGLVMVREGETPTAPSLCFGLAEVETFKYGDSRAFPAVPRFASALCFAYPDGAQVALFEIALEG